MTASLEPGSVLDDRYRLDERIGEPGCAVLWRAFDTILARNVSVLVLPAEGEDTERVMTAARRASRIRDPRVVQVYDTAYDKATAEDVTAGFAYVVSEWVEGRTLTDLLVNGPLHAERAGGLVGEAAEALAAAHQVAVAHLRLTPDSLVWTSAGGVKVTGVGIDAALTRTESADPGRTDAEGLGALLYAALTGRWPGLGPADGYDGLPSAPVSNGTPITSPRQVRAGVPPELDATTDRALSQRSRRGHPPLANPAAVADALADYPDPTPLDFFGGLGGTEPTPAPVRSGRDDRDAGAARVPARPFAASGTPAARGTAGGDARSHGLGVLAGAGTAHRPRTARMLVAVPAGLLVIALVLVGGWRLATSGPGIVRSGQSPSASATASKSPTDVGRKAVPVVAAEAFDPDGDRTEHSDDVRNAYDGTPRTVWYTDRYNSADLGNLKPGVGIVFDLGSSRSVAALDLRLTSGNGDVELRTADAKGSSVGDYKRVAAARGTGERVTLRPSKPVSARYWLVWFTKLPSGDGGYRAGVADTTFRPAG